MRIGIVGSGIAGLTAAWIFQRAGCDVTIFESQERLGMDAHSMSIPRSASDNVQGDVPSRMFNRLLWPRLFQMYEQLRVEFEPVDASQSFSHEAGSYLTLQIANRPIQMAKQMAQAVFSPRSLKLLKEAKRLKANGETDLKSGVLFELTFLQYLNQNRFSADFIYDFLFPTLSSTVCTCSYNALAGYPAIIILKTLYNLSREEPLLKTKFGTRDVVRRLVDAIPDVRLMTKVKSVIQRGSHVEGSHVELTAEQNKETSQEVFDHVVISTQANHAIALMPHITEEETKMLGAFQYENVPVLVHTDAGLMPLKRGDWATFNMISQRDGVDDSSSDAMCSVWMNRFHADWDPSTQDVFQTINPIRSPKASSVICAANLQRPIVTTESQSSWDMLENLHAQADRRIWFGGSYAKHGVPLLETAVESSQSVAARICEGTDLAIQATREATS